MKFIKVATLVLALSVSAVVSAKGVEEFCHDVANADVDVKQLFQEDTNALKGILEQVNKSEKNPKIKAALRERVYWVYNRKDLSDELLRKLSFLQCSVRMQ